MLFVVETLYESGKVQAREREEEKNAAMETERHSHWWVWVDEHGSAIPLNSDGDG